jgi:hypothetical protein
VNGPPLLALYFPMRVHLRWARWRGGSQLLLALGVTESLKAPSARCAGHCCRYSRKRHKPIGAHQSHGLAVLVLVRPGSLPMRAPFAGAQLIWYGAPYFLRRMTKPLRAVRVERSEFGHIRGRRRFNFFLAAAPESLPPCPAVLVWALVGRQSARLLPSRLKRAPVVVVGDVQPTVALAWAANLLDGLALLGDVALALLAERSWRAKQ